VCSVHYICVCILGINRSLWWHRACWHC